MLREKFNYTPGSNKSTDREFWFHDIDNIIKYCPAFAFCSFEAAGLRYEMRELIYNLSRIYLFYEAKLNPKPMLQLCGEAMDKRFKSPRYQVGRVSLPAMAYLLRLKAKLKVNYFDGLTSAKSGNAHAGKFFYLAAKTPLGNCWEENKTIAAIGIDDFRSLIKAATSSLPLKSDGYQADPAFLLTMLEYPQPPHRDMQGYDNGEDWLHHFCPFILHLPLCEEGMYLNVWEEPNNKNVAPLRIHIPFGTYLLLRVDVVHGGVFGSPGNVRLHIAFRPLKTAIENFVKTEEENLTDDDKKSCLQLGMDRCVIDKDRALETVPQAYDTKERVDNHGGLVNIIEPEQGYAVALIQDFPNVAPHLGALKVKSTKKKDPANKSA